MSENDLIVQELSCEAIDTDLTFSQCLQETLDIKENHDNEINSTQEFSTNCENENNIDLNETNNESTNIEGMCSNCVRVEDEHNFDESDDVLIIKDNYAAKYTSDNTVPVCQWTEAFKNVIEVYSDSDDEISTDLPTNVETLDIVIKVEKPNTYYTPCSESLYSEKLNGDIKIEKNISISDSPTSSNNSGENDCEYSLTELNDDSFINIPQINNDLEITDQHDYREAFARSEADSESVIETSCSSTEDTSDDDMAAEYNSSLSEGEIEPVIKKNTRRNWKSKKKRINTDYEDLPPIHELKISLDESEELRLVGTVINIIHTKVIVESEKEIPAINLDSVLFLENRKPLGQVFDVFGRVDNPRYVVLLSSEEEAEKLGLVNGTKVYFAPKAEEITSYVFVSSLLKEKGSDASWIKDCEPPERHLDYSDDEKERAAKAKFRKKYKKVEENNEMIVKDSDQDRSVEDWSTPEFSQERPDHLNSNDRSYADNYQPNWRENCYPGSVPPFFQFRNPFSLRPSQFFQHPSPPLHFRSRYSHHRPQRFGRPPQFSSFIPPPTYPLVRPAHFSMTMPPGENFNFFNPSSEHSFQSPPLPPPFSHSPPPPPSFSHSPPPPPSFSHSPPSHFSHSTATVFSHSPPPPSPLTHSSPPPFPNSPPPPPPFPHSSPPAPSFPPVPTPISSSSFLSHSSPSKCTPVFGKPWTVSECLPPFGQPNY